MSGTVQQRGEHSARDPRHVVRTAGEFTQLQLSFPLKVRVIQTWLDNHLPHQFQGLGQRAGFHRESQFRGVAIGRDIQCGSQGIEGLGQLSGGLLRRSLVPHRRGQLRQAGAVGRIVGAADGHEQAG